MTMKCTLFFLSLSLMTLTVMGQNASKHSLSINMSASITMSAEQDDWNVSLQHLEAPKPGSNSLRAELARKKQEIMRRYPRQMAEARSTVVETPSIENNFEGNSFQGIPNDNDMAISNDSIIVSVTNRRIHMYNAVTEEQLLTRSLHSLSSDLDISGAKYDPKVVYDPNNNRFVMVFLNGFTWETSQIIVAFSQTADPTAEWHLYALPGNPLNNDTWSDYPVIGISGKDLYIGINTFYNGSENNSGFVETCLWQIGLKEGYIGFDLITNYFNDILPQSKSIFNICPISPAAESDMENMFLLSNRNTDLQNDTVFLLEVTGRVNDPATELVVTTLQADQDYILPVPAAQQGNHWLDTNDGRVLGGYLRNGNIHYVQSCTDPISGRSAIWHGLINNVETEPLIVSRIYAEPDLDYGYPNISWSGQSDNDEQAIISFNHSSESDFAGFSAIYVDGNLEASDRVEIKTGLTIVNVLSDTLERWGDYSGSQRMYNEPGKVWAVGSFGQSAGHRTWIAEILSPDVATDIKEPNTLSHSSVYPNPFKNDLSIEFEIAEPTFLRLELVDVNGRMVKLLLEDRVRAGLNSISFNEDLLSSGQYFLVGTSMNEVILKSPVIKQ